jgi:outer membrane protein OmpA-like peptidoglycan-associated protein
MKKLLVLSFFLTQSAFALVTTETSDFWLYGSLDLGLSTVSTDVANELDDKKGYNYGAGIYGSYNFQEHLTIDLGLGWIYNRFESEVINNRKVRLITETFYLELNPRYRFRRRWSVGPVFTLITGEEFLAAPNPQLTNVDGDGTTDKLVGLNVMYDYPWKKIRGRMGVKVLRAIDLNNRDSYLAMFSLQFGFPFWKETKALPAPPQPVSPSPFPEDAEVVAKIELGEQLINFKTNSSTLDEKSDLFLQKLGAFLGRRLDAYEGVQVDGHTDSTGSNQYNLKLSNNRAESVYKALIKGGAPVERLRYVGFGEEQPKVPGDDPEARSINRRVELNFIGYIDEDAVQREIDNINDEIGR